MAYAFFFTSPRTSHSQTPSLSFPFASPLAISAKVKSIILLLFSISFDSNATLFSLYHLIFLFYCHLIAYFVLFVLLQLNLFLYAISTLRILESLKPILCFFFHRWFHLDFTVCTRSFVRSFFFWLHRFPSLSE